MKVDVLTSGYVSMDHIIKIATPAKVGFTSLVTNKSNSKIFYGGCSVNIAYALCRLGMKAMPVLRVGGDYESNRANYLSDILASQAAQDIMETLPTAYANGNDIKARETMVQASMVAGIAFTNVSLGIVHSMAHTIGGIFHVSHGLADAIILPYIIRYNEQNETAKEVYAKFAKRIGAENLHEAVEALNEKLNIPKCFKEIIPDEEKYMEKLDEMAPLAKADGCTKTNPVIPEIDEFKELFIKVYRGE